jgi:hypothetical protein
MNEASIVDEHERRIIDAVMTLARSFRDDREALARRLSAVEHALDALTLRVELQPSGPPAGTGTPGGPPPAPSRTPS